MENNVEFDINETPYLVEEGILEPINDYENLTPENRLWRAVIFQMFADLENQSNEKKKQILKHLARAWFANIENKETVKEVCNFARLDYKKVIDTFKQIIKQDRFFS